MKFSGDSKIHCLLHVWTQSLFDNVPFAAMDSYVYSAPIIWFVFPP